MPLKNFLWRAPLTTEEITQYDAATSEKGYFLEVDVEIPTHLHNYFNDLPPFPETIDITESMASPSTKKARADSNRFRDGCKFSCPKLAPNLNPKYRYKCHISALQLFLSLGCILVKVHRVLEFTHAEWLSPYIWHNTIKRQQSQSDFSRKYFKLMNNAFFGKCMEVRI